MTLAELQKFAKEKLATYKVPRLALFVDEIPKNAMGKVSKKPLVNLFPKQK